MIVTIDGYAGTGKSTVAKLLAERLGFALLNTGAMYRAVGFLLSRHNIDIQHEPRPIEQIAALLQSFRFDMPSNRIRVNNEDVTEHVFSEAMGNAASKVATFPEVRTRLKAEQRRIAAHGDFVCEGRDQGTAVFPDAAFKFFLTASAEVRADRRVLQLEDRGIPTDPPTILKEILARDHQDETRPIDPLAKAADALEIDTSHLTLAEVVERLWNTVQRSRLKESPEN
jgi:CMP/dCMP kinase